MTFPGARPLFLPIVLVSDLSFAGTFLTCIQILPYLIPHPHLPDRHGHIGTANIPIGKSLKPRQEKG